MEELEEVPDLPKNSLESNQEEVEELKEIKGANSCSLFCIKHSEVFTKFQTIITEYLSSETIVSLDDVIKGVVSSYSMAGYLDFSIPSGKEIIVTKLLQQCCFLLQDLLRISDGICYTHDEATAAIIQLIQMQLLNLYPKYSTQGYEALYSCPPTIYISPLCIPSLGSMICKKLGFPLSCVKIMKMEGQEILKVEKSLQEDLAAKRVPLMIIASSGSHHSGQVDNLISISHLAQRFNTWLHLEGLLIGHLSLSDQPKKTLQVADSLHLDLRQLLGIPSLPFVTMYRHCEIALQRAACLTPSHCSPFNVVPLWFALQSFDSSIISTRFRIAVELCRLLVNHLITIPNVKIMSHVPKIIKSQESIEPKDLLVPDPDDNTLQPAEALCVVEPTTNKKTEDAEDAEEEEMLRFNESLTESDVVSNAYCDDFEPSFTEKTKPDTLMNNVAPVLVFQYRPKTTEFLEEYPTNLLDDLNLWLIQVLERECNMVHIDIIDIDDNGYALRFSPLDCKPFPTTENVERFLKCLDQQLDILNATVAHKATLMKLIDDCEELQMVELPGWAGLGGVRYLPVAWRSKNVEQLPDQGKEEINKINRELVAKLKETDSAFSLGEGKDGLSCVRFGMVVAITDVEALANLVRQTGLDLEASTLALETMAVMIRKGIEEAQAELQRETEEKLWQEGLLRHIPVVGSLVNFFSPPSKTTMKGRSLNLQNGRIEKTDVMLHNSVETSSALANQEMPLVGAEETEIASAQ